VEFSGVYKGFGYSFLLSIKYLSKLAISSAMAKDHLCFLMYIAEKSDDGVLRSSTVVMSKELGVSQQTVSRTLREMEDKQLIARRASPSGIVSNILGKGTTMLENYCGRLKMITEKKKPALKGKVVSGLGEGRYYISMPQYAKQIKNLLGFKPFLGTLNIKTNNLEYFLADKKSVKISGFKTKERSYGDIAAYVVKVCGINGAILIPERSTHTKDIVELIAAVNLRKNLNLKDGDEVKIL
jgi:riboflavin kinase